MSLAENVDAREMLEMVTAISMGEGSFKWKGDDTLGSLREGIQ